MFPIDLLAPARKIARLGIQDPADTARLIEETCRQTSNWRRQRIGLREVLASEAYQQSSSPLTVALGQTAKGQPYCIDLATMPHLLIAGARDTGKATGLIVLLTSILHRASPDDVRLILVDTADAGLNVFAGIPHLQAPVITEAREAAITFRWAVSEMERRYRVLAAAGVRNLAQYNRSIRQGQLPHIVVVVSELAEPMMAAPVDVDEAIVRLGQMSRAVGIHLVLATKHFSVGVLTGLIKANLPGRIAYRVATKVESRTILDRNGAERLLGAGDMLFLPPASCDAIRLHGPFVTARELAAVANYLRQQGSARLDFAVTADDSALRGPAPEADPLFDLAARLVRATGQTSIPDLQRRLGIGFSRAARLLDRIQADGLG
jgi:S-DNA-T family DNA segregation ATPase FtsK/SpoIIIE